MESNFQNLDILKSITYMYILEISMCEIIFLSFYLVRTLNSCNCLLFPYTVMIEISI